MCLGGGVGGKKLLRPQQPKKYCGRGGGPGFFGCGGARIFSAGPWVCERVEELDPFIDRILVLSNKAESKGDEIVCTMDVEEDFVNPKVSNQKDYQFF